MNLWDGRSDDKQVINVDCKEHHCIAGAAHVYAWLSLTMLETKSLKLFVKGSIPQASSLLETVQCFLQPVTLAFSLLCLKCWQDSDINVLVKLPVQECSTDIELCDVQTVLAGEGK